MARTPRVRQIDPITNYATPRIPAGTGFAALADATEFIAEQVRPAAIQAAREQGVSSVYRDENGVLRVNTKSPLGGEMAIEHNRAALTSYLAQQRVDTRETVNELRLRHDGDPAAFRNAMQSYRKMVLNGAPPLLRADVGANIDSEALHVFNGMQVQLLRETEAKATRDLFVSRKMNKQDAVNLFLENRGEITPEFQAKMNEIADQTRLLMEMGEESEADIELQMRETMDTAQSEWEARLRSDVDEAIEIIRSGNHPANEAELLKDVDGTPLEEPLVTAIAARSLVPTFARMSPTEQRDTLDRIRAAPMTPERQMAFDELLKIHDNTKEAVADDPLGAAVDAGARIGGIDLMNPQTIAARKQASLALRVRGFNPTERYFTDPEKAELSERIAVASPEEKATIAQSMITGFGDAAPRAIRELEVEGVFGHGAQLLASGANPRNVQLMFAGEMIQDRPRPDKATREEAEPEVLGPMAEALPPEIYASLVPKVREAANAYYSARVGTVDESDLPDLYVEALQAALGRSNGTGGIQAVNGYQTFLPPKVQPGIAESALSQVFDRLQAVAEFDKRKRAAGIGGRVAQSFAAVAQQARMAFNSIMSSPSVSISGGVPMNGRDPVSFSDSQFLRLVAVDDDVYELHVEKGDGNFVALTDSVNNGAYLMSLKGLIQATP